MLLEAGSLLLTVLLMIVMRVLTGEIPGPAEVSDDSTVDRLETTERAETSAYDQGASVACALVR